MDFPFQYDNFYINVKYYIDNYIPKNGINWVNISRLAFIYPLIIVGYWSNNRSEHTNRAQFKHEQLLLIEQLF